jgi:hypothetical protein
MNFKLWHRVSATIVFLVSTIIFLMTVAPTLSFWDCGEFITSSVIMGVPHPPGAPFFQIVGRLFTLIPFSADLGYRMNLISAFSSSVSVLFTYLVIMRLFRMWKGDPTTMAHALIMFLSAATGALVLSFSDTFWFSAVESEVYAIGMLFISIVVWIGLEWYTRSGVFASERSLLLIAYIIGLSIGVHLLSLLAIFFVFFLVYFRDRRREEMTPKSILIFLALMFGGFAAIYPGVVKFIPSLLSGSAGTWFVVVLVAAMLWIVASKKLHPQFRMAVLAALLVVLGYSTYAIIPIRANDEPAMNENDPKDLATLYSYLNREQYGSYPLMRGPNYDDAIQRINPEVKKFLPRRWNPENVQAYSKYSSDFEYFVKYQFGHIFLRYFLWNFVGRAGDVQDAPVAFVTDPGDWSESTGYPNRYYAIPLILGLLGIYFHFRKDWKTATSTMALFLVMGLGLVVYFNMCEPQVRERDYFFIGAFYVFTIWVGLGVYGLWELIREKFGSVESIGVAIAGIAIVIAPLNMLKENFQTHTRHLNYVAFDYAYDLLQSCDQDAILFTGGDNDTFPLWYLQYAAGVRRDVRIVNLSLVNTNWYAKQLKNSRPYGAKAVAMSYSDVELDQMRPVQWDKQQINIPIDAAKFPMSDLKDVPAIQGQAIPSTLSLTVDATYTDPDGKKGLRQQDLMIIDILQNNISTRPIYFALSTAPSDRVGLDGHLIVEGLASRVTPYTFPQRGDRYYPTINVPVTLRHLTTARAAADSNRAFGFMFRELDNPKINLDEASTKMIMSFRYLFMGLSQVIYQDFNDGKKSGEVIDRMNKVMPPAYHKMDIVMKTDLSTMYFLMGDTTRFRTIAGELETYYLGELEKDITGRSASRSPYSVLLNIYEMTGQFQKGIDLMKRYAMQYPDDQSVKTQIASWERKARGEKEPPKDSMAATPR